MHSQQTHKKVLPVHFFPLHSFIHCYVCMRWWLCCTTKCTYAGDIHIMFPHGAMRSSSAFDVGAHTCIEKHKKWEKNIIIKLARTFLVYTECTYLNYFYNSLIPSPTPKQMNVFRYYMCTPRHCLTHLHPKTTYRCWCMVVVVFTRWMVTRLTVKVTLETIR